MALSRMTRNMAVAAPAIATPRGARGRVRTVAGAVSSLILASFRRGF